MHNNDMRILLLSLALMVGFNQSLQAADLKQFMADCAYGVGFGAVAGVVSMALTDKPSEHTRNVAMGASLGLYGGIGYGLYRMQGEASSGDYVRLSVSRTDTKDGLALFVASSF